MFSGPGRAPASFYLASAAKLPLKCRQARVCLLRAFTSRVFSGCLFPAKCIRLCDPVFWQSKRKPKNCWHLQQNFVFCVIAITRLRTGNSFKTSSDEFTKSLIFPTAKNSTQKPHSHWIFIMSIYFSHSVSGGQWPWLRDLALFQTLICLLTSSFPVTLTLRGGGSVSSVSYISIKLIKQTSCSLCKPYKKSFSIFSC